MCAILDANVVHKVFGSGSSTEGRQFFDWLDRGKGRLDRGKGRLDRGKGRLDRGKGRLVIGGKVKDELCQNGDFERWATEQSREGQLVVYVRKSKKMSSASVVEYDDTEVKAKTRSLEEQKARGERHFGSDDPHVIALALISGARLLYSDDGKLQQDFKDIKLVPSPQGKVYSNSSKAHRRLLYKTVCRL